MHPGSHLLNRRDGRCGAGSRRRRGSRCICCHGGSFDHQLRRVGSFAAGEVDIRVAGGAEGKVIGPVPGDGGGDIHP